MLDKELYLTATDLDTCERIVFGEEGWNDVPISKAVQCSTALPIVYKPVDLKGRQLVDGGIRSTTNVDIAVEKGAKFIVVVNPLVPFVNDFEKTIPTVFGTRVRRVSDMGLPAIANQTFRLIAHARLHQAVEPWQESYPGVDIILVEPEPNDELMFGTPIMDYSRRLKIARHGFESVTATLAKDYDRFKEIAERHGLEISEPPRQPRGRAGGRRGARAELGLAPRARADDLGRCCASPARRLRALVATGRIGVSPHRELMSHAPASRGALRLDICETRLPTAPRSRSCIGRLAQQGISRLQGDAPIAPPRAATRIRYGWKEPGGASRRMSPKAAMQSVPSRRSRARTLQLMREARAIIRLMGYRPSQPLARVELLDLVLVLLATTARLTFSVGVSSPLPGRGRGAGWRSS